MSPRRATLLLVVVTAVVTTACGGSRTVPAEWQLVAAPQGTVLELEVAVGLPCNELGDVGVLESSSQVQVQVAVQRTTEECDSMFVTETTTVQLSQPLGDRELTGCTPVDEDTIRFGTGPRGPCGPGD